MGGHVDSDEIWLTGRTDPPPGWRRLRNGRLEMLLDGVDLRSINYDGIEIVQQLYVAVRDRTWNTLAGSITELDLIQRTDATFAVTFDSSHMQSESDFDWHGEIRGSADGVIDYSLSGRTRTGMEYSRIGFNVICGIEPYRGRPYRAQSNGTHIEGRLPDLVGPQVVKDGRETGLFEPFDRLELSPVDGVWVVFEFVGDEFEMEDQRNYGDGSYKTYSTPLQRAGPFNLAPNVPFEQSLRMSVTDQRGRGRAFAVAHPDAVYIGPATDRRVPAFGLAHAADGNPMPAPAVERLLPLAPDHIRLELDVADGIDSAAGALEIAASDARLLGCDLHVELGDVTLAQSSLTEYVTTALAVDPPPSRLLLRGRSMAPVDRGALGEALTVARVSVEQAGASTSVGIATDFLAELICTPFDADVVRTASFGLCPTVHRSDDTSIMENLIGIESEVSTARAAVGAGELLVGPIMLATRHGPYPDGPVRPDGLPPSVDRRQASLFAAAWTLGCLAALSRTRLDGLTLYETRGWRGTMAGPSGSALPASVSQADTRTYPLWHVLADIAELRECRLHSLDVGPPGVVGLAAMTATGMVLLLASTRRSVVEFTVHGIPGRTVLVRTLDASSARMAVDEPSAFRASSTRVDVSDGGVALALDPYTVVRVAADR